MPGWGCRLPSVQKKRKKAKSRRGYYLGAIVLAVIIGVGVYAVASSQPPSIVYAKLNTTQGLIEVELYQSKAPKTVTNFVNLAKSGFYDNLVWHRIVDGFVIQTGDPLTRDGVGDRGAWGSGNSSQTVPLETDSSLHNYSGYLAMAHLQNQPDSGTSQFYINLVDNTSLDGDYTVFGRVTSGMDVARRIASLPVDSEQKPLEPLPFLTTVTISNSP